MNNGTGKKDCWSFQTKVMNMFLVLTCRKSNNSLIRHVLFG